MRRSDLVGADGQQTGVAATRLPSVRAETRGAIPLVAHFVWFGRDFPWVNVLAIRSAALRGGFTTVVLHHDSDLSETEHYEELLETPGLVLEPLHAPELLRRCLPFSAELSRVFARLRTPTAKSDLIRLAILYSEGGVYLDLDTVTVGSLAPLCADTNAFCGQERIVYPVHVRSSRDPRVRLTAVGRSALRSLLRRAPRGWAAFQRIEHLYPLGVNNAVLASGPGSTFLRKLIERLVALPPACQVRPYALGPHLLQQAVADDRGTGLIVHEPEMFFPLSPEISAHWFGPGRASDLQSILTPRTRVVHWYASVRTRQRVSRIDPAFVRANAQRQLFSALALPLLRTQRDR